MTKAPEREIYLIRHGETDFNRKGIIQGRGVNSNINEKGRRQAQAFFDHYGHLPFSSYFASNLIRTQQTLEPFTNAGFKVQVHAGLDEIDWGIHEGKAADKELSKDYHCITGKWKEGVLSERIPGGESPIELQKRQLIFVNEVLPLYTGKILICSHGRAMRALMCTLLGKSLSYMDDFPHRNVSLYRLHQHNGNYEIIDFNFTDHLRNI